MCGGDIEKHDFVRPGFAMRLRQRGRIARVAQVQELHALDDASAVNVEACDDAFGQHIKAHKNCAADAIQCLRIFRDETELRTDDRAPRLPKMCLHTRTAQPYLQLEGREKSGKSTRTLATVFPEKVSSGQRHQDGSIPREDMSPPRESAGIRRQRCRGLKSA